MKHPPEEETPFEKRARALLEESATRLDGRMRSRLTQARHAALAQSGKPARAWWYVGVPAGATAAALLAVVMLNRPPAPPDTGSAVEDIEMLADADAPDFVDDEELEFYEWAAGEMES
jgi:negative regulator of sigma E activity